MEQTRFSEMYEQTWVLSGATDCYFNKHVVDHYTQQYKNNDDDDDLSEGSKWLKIEQNGQGVDCKVRKPIWGRLLLWNFPGGTEDNIRVDDISLDQDLNPGTPQYDTLIAIIQGKYSIIIMMINRGNKFSK